MSIEGLTRMVRLWRGCTGLINKQSNNYLIENKQKYMIFEALLEVKINKISEKTDFGQQKIKRHSQ